MIGRQASATGGHERRRIHAAGSPPRHERGGSGSGAGERRSRRSRRRLERDPARARLLDARGVPTASGSFPSPVSRRGATLYVTGPQRVIRWVGRRYVAGPRRDRPSRSRPQADRARQRCRRPAGGRGATGSRLPGRPQSRLYLRAVRDRPREPARPCGRAGCRRGARRGLQPAVPPWAARPRQDPPARLDRQLPPSPQPRVVHYTTAECFTNEFVSSLQEPASTRSRSAIAAPTCS